MSDGGSLTVSIENEEKNLIFSIKDTGHGISKDCLEVIFNPFYTDKDSGTGLGLAVSQKIVEDHDGDIDVASVVGEGTEFRIKLPKKGA